MGVKVITSSREFRKIQGLFLSMITGGSLHPDISETILFMISYPEVVSSLTFMSLSLSTSPDDSSSRGGAGTANGDPEHAPELAGKLGKHARRL